MSLSFFKSTGFKIKELKLRTKSGIDENLIFFYEELNIFDSILQPCLTGNILVRDSVGLVDKLLLDGNDFLKIHIGKTEEDGLEIKRIFRIYKLTDRQSNNQNSESYILHFVSEEYITALTKKVGQLYKDITFSDNVTRILQDHMNTPREKLNNGYFDQSLGFRDNTFPINLNPIHAIKWLTNNSIDLERRPCFLFYENIFGYNFVSLTSLLKKDTVVQINFDPKNLNTSNEVKNFLGARYFKVLQQFDILSIIKNGVYSSKLISFDRSVQQGMQIDFTFNTINHPMDSKNKGFSVPNLRTVNGELLDAALGSNIVESVTTQLRSGVKSVKEDNPGKTEKSINYEQIVAQRPAIFANFFSQRVKLVVPGNFSISSGANVLLNVPKFSEKSPGVSNLDRSLYGNYIVIAARHKLTPDNLHETIFEACTNSSNRNIDSKSIIGMSDYPDQNYG